MSENRREIMCATRRYHHGRDFGELFSFFFLPQQQKKRKSDNLVWIFVLYLFPFHFPFKRKNIPLLRSQQSLDLNFDGDTLPLSISRPQYQGCLLAGHRYYWICAFEMIHPSVYPSPPQPKNSTRQHARLIDNFQSQRRSLRCTGLFFVCVCVFGSGEQEEEVKDMQYLLPIFLRGTISRSKSQSNWIHRTHKSGFLGRPCAGMIVVAIRLSARVYLRLWDSIQECRR